MADEIEWLSISETSNGAVQLTIQKGNGYSDDYYMLMSDLRYLFNRGGKVLRDADDQ